MIFDLRASNTHLGTVARRCPYIDGRCELSEADAGP